MDYRLIFLSLGNIVISWGGVPLANPGMALKMPCLNNKTVVIGKSVTAFIQVAGNSSRKTGEAGRSQGTGKASQRDIYQSVPTTDTGGLVE
jgi:hypothetical protein